MTTDHESTPAGFIEAWGLENIGDGIPSPEMLTAVARALHAVQEFLVEPIADALKQVSAASRELDHGRPGGYPIPEGERAVTYENTGRLIAWTDELRQDIGYLFDPIKKITLLAHEDLADIAGGYVPDGATFSDHSWTEELRRMHGLDRVLA